MKNLPTIKDLIESGAHFGHLRARSHPKATRQFAFDVRDHVVLINLDDTLSRLMEAAGYLKEAAKEGKTILFVGTKPPIQEVVTQAALQASCPYVSTRWLAGTLTNFDEVIKNVKALQRLETKLQETEESTKREKVKLAKRVANLHKLFDGISSLTRLPDLLLIIDADHEKIALEEARKAGVPVVAISDTNVDPTKIDYPIPANDDSKATVEILLKVLVEAISDGKAKSKAQMTND